MPEALHQPRDLDVVVFATTGRDGPVACDLLERAGCRASRCATVGELETRIRDGAGVLVLATESIEGAEALQTLLAALDDQPSWSDVPVILFTGSRSNLERLQPLIARHSTALLGRPVRTSSFLSVVRSSLEDRRRQYELRDLLDELSASNERLGQRAQQLQRLALQLSESEEQERRRMAGVLHDDLQQLLVGASLRLAAVRDVVARGEPADSGLDALGDLLKSAQQLARGLSHELNPPGLRRGGLVTALQWLCERMQWLHGLEIALDADEDVEPADERVLRLLYRAVQELLLNIVKHAGCDRARLGLRAAGDHVVVEVSDQGRGFDPGALESDATPETGLGLFGIRERIEVLGGSLEIDSSPGAGSRLTLRVPRRVTPSGIAELTPPKGRPAVPSSVETPSPPSADGALRVLLVDDHEVMRRGLRILLSSQPGVEVVGEASNGREAVDAAERLRPNVVVMDISMPVMDGVTATGYVRELLPEARIIGLSMFEESEMARRMIEAGADLYLQKTGSSDELLDAVRNSR